MRKIRRRVRDGRCSVGPYRRVRWYQGDRLAADVERLSHFFTANGITEAAKKRAVFLSVIGAASYKTLRNILSPAKPGDKSYAELVEKLSKYFRPAPSEIVERFKFHSRSRLPGESVATFVAEVRSLSEFCNFGDTLDVMFRDRLVCGSTTSRSRNGCSQSWDSPMPKPWSSLNPLKLQRRV